MNEATNWKLFDNSQLPRRLHCSLPTQWRAPATVYLWISQVPLIIPTPIRALNCEIREAQMKYNSIPKKIKECSTNSETRMAGMGQSWSNWFQLPRLPNFLWLLTVVKIFLLSPPLSSSFSLSNKEKTRQKKSKRRKKIFFYMQLPSRTAPIHNEDVT